MARPRGEYKVQWNVQLPLRLAEYVDNLPFRTRSEAMEAIIQEHWSNHNPGPIAKLWTEECDANKASKATE